MNELNILLHEDRHHFQPGEELAGEAAWHLEQAPGGAELRLIWFTTGPREIVAEAAIIRTIAFDKPRQSDRREFKFRLPDGPYSFSGPLATLLWGVELVMLPSRRHAIRKFHLAPSGKTIFLLGDLDWHAD